MRYLSLFSGIEAATVAWHPLGWEPVAFAEIEPFPSAVLKHHYPSVPNLGDVTKADFSAIGPVDLVVFGSPCQSFSVAGKRLGLDDPRGNLALYALGVVAKVRPKWFLFENVPGLLSSDEGRDFGAFLRTVGECGYQCAWRILDAQHFGVPQRRRRVFVVGHIGDWRRAAAVLFERESLSGNPAPRLEAGEGIANSLTERPDRGGGNSEGQRLIPQVAQCHTAGGQTRLDPETETLIPTVGGGFDGPEIAPCLTQNYGKQPDNSDTSAGPMLVTAFDWQTGGDMRGIDPRPTAQLQRGQVPAVAFNEVGQTLTSGGRGERGRMDPVNTDLAHGSAVRRLTPRECERLQGFPDDYTLVPYRNKPAAAGPRYKALGNSMAVPVMRWIGERIARVEQVELAVAA